ncbi:MAG: hypothetical protein RL261_1038, partial [Pseudomonadota bacterium]
LPPGLGMLVLGVDHVDVQQNRIEKNDFVGVGMIDWCLALGDPGCQAEDNQLPPGFEDSALDYTRIVGNKFAGNHAGTPPPGPFETLGSDILYVDASYFVPFLPAGTQNCQSDNKLIKTSGNPSAQLIALPPDLLSECK